MQVLIVEDDPTSRLLLQRTLERMGYEVEAAAGGEAGWARFQAWRPSIVVTDWMMPDLDGLELCRRIRGDARYRRYTYVIVLTALAGKSSYLEGMNAGADDFVTKPFDPDQLLARLRVAERILALEADREAVLALLPSCPDCCRVAHDGRWQSLDRLATARRAAVSARPLCPDCQRARVRDLGVAVPAH